MRVAYIFFLIFTSFSCKSPEEEARQAAFTGDQFTRLEGETFLNLYDTSDTLSDETYIGFLLDSNGILFLAKMHEDDIKYNFVTRDTCIWKDPCAEFFIDPGADGKNYYELQINAKPQIWDLKLKSNQPPINAPGNMLEWDIGDNFGNAKTWGTPNDDSDIDKYWQIVGSISWEDFAEGRPKKGDRWAYNFMRVNYDKQGQPSYWVLKSTGKKNIHHPETWPVHTF